MATIEFLAGENFTINNLAGSGLGFYGASFGASVGVGEYQTTTFITNAAGTALGPQCDNIKYLNTASGIVNSSTSGIALTAIPNYQATLNIRFTHDTPVSVENVELRIYDRSNINNNPSGVTCKVAELIHPTTSQVNNGSGSTTWVTPVGSSLVMSLISSPGDEGSRPNGAGTVDDEHDWYVAISASPNSVGAKSQFALYFSLEYV